MNIEIVCVKLTIVSSNIFIILCYIPQNLNPMSNNLYDSFLQHLYYNNKQVIDELLILGD